jgi:outer membrane lipase/esterase
MIPCTRRLLVAAMLSIGFWSSQGLAQNTAPTGSIENPDFVYGRRVAPSEASFLAESAVKTRRGLISAIQTEIGLSQSHRGPAGVNAWFGGNVIAMAMDNYPGFPNDPDTAVTGTAGVDYTVAPGLIAGFALSRGSLDSSFGKYGSFSADDTTASLYAALQRGSLWANAIGTYGRLSFDMNRIVPIGATLHSNTSSSGGDNWSAALQGGYVFSSGAITHGPVLGLVYQNVSLDGFKETGDYTSLEFGSQMRESSVSQLGYLAIYDLGKYQPYVEALWNHELANTSRDVSVQLISKALPALSMPAVLLGKDWGEAKAGVKIDVGKNLKLVLEGSADFGQTSTTLYGGQIGFNVSF